MNYNEIKSIIEELKKRTKQKAFSLKICKDKIPGLCDSKLGGVPYWDNQRMYPVDSSGNQLMLLAQINLEQYDFGELLPMTGMLQFFTGLDDVFGVDVDERDRQDTFRVVYHETVNYDVTREEVMSLGYPTNLDEKMREYSPVSKEYALEISKAEVYMSERDYRFESLFREIAKEQQIKLKVEESLYDLIEEKAYDQMVEEMTNTGHWVLGYPFFTQSDPRMYTEEYHYYDTMLFQLDSEYYDDGEGDMVLWGDCGVGNFFMNNEDLKNCNFNKVLYNWDCM